jgi:hypothetical protein
MGQRSANLLTSGAERTLERRKGAAPPFLSRAVNCVGVSVIRCAAEDVAPGTKTTKIPQKPTLIGVFLCKAVLTNQEDLLWLGFATRLTRG